MSESDEVPLFFDPFGGTEPAAQTPGLRKTGSFRNQKRPKTSNRGLTRSRALQLVAKDLINLEKQKRPARDDHCTPSPTEVPSADL
jgi:hypothetical protein